jgi:hypothetical protein
VDSDYLKCARECFLFSFSFISFFSLLQNGQSKITQKNSSQKIKKKKNKITWKRGLNWNQGLFSLATIHLLL